jgi:hypothetical protein
MTVRAGFGLFAKPSSVWNFSHCDLPFDLAQGGELVEPFGICGLLFEIF